MAILAIGTCSMDKSGSSDIRPPTYFIRTFGCQMNVADSLQYANILERLGCVRAENEVCCDVLIINTCSVREKAEQRAISYIGAVSRERNEHREKYGVPGKSGIVFVGCMATVRGDEILRRFGEIRTIVSAREFDKFEDRIIGAWPELVGASAENPELPLLRPEDKFERFVPITRGCVNRCTYCIVPAARGDRIISKSPNDIFTEVDELIESGVKAITFLGQNVCAYGSEIRSKIDSDETTPHGWEDYHVGYDFSDLLSDIRDRFGDKDIWIKFLTSHPRDVTNKLIDVLAGHPAFSRHFHLPIQAGDDEILKRMGRGYTSGYYVEMIGMIREKIPDMRLSTDIIVGFPGEDEKAFENTLDILKTIRFDSAFTFLYSTRTGTPAEKWADPVPIAEKKRRLNILIDLQNRITLENAQDKIGQERIVLVEGPATHSKDKSGGMVAGRTREEEVVVLPGDAEDFGKRVRVRLIDAKLRSFIGERLE